MLRSVPAHTGESPQVARDLLQFHVAETILASGLTCSTLTIGPLRNTTAAAGFDRLREEVLQQVLSGLTPDTIEADEILQGFRRLHQAFGVSNRRNVAAP